MESLDNTLFYSVAVFIKGLEAVALRPEFGTDSRGCVDNKSDFYSKEI